MSIIGKLFNLKTSTDYSAAIEQLRAERDVVERRLGDLSSQLATAPFDSPKVDFVRLRQAVREAEDELDHLNLVVQAAEQRQREAVAREAAAAIERHMEEMRKECSLLRADYRSIHEAAEALAKACLQARERKRVIMDGNELARKQGRHDLVITLPLVELVAAIKTQVWDPCELTLRDYLPRHPDGPPLARLNEVAKR